MFSELKKIPFYVSEEESCLHSQMLDPSSLSTKWAAKYKTALSWQEWINCLMIFFILQIVGGKQMLPMQWVKVFFLLWRAGYVNKIILDACHETEPLQFYFRISSPFFPLLTDGRVPPYEKYSRGFSTDSEVALSKCIGECIERTPFLYFRKRELITASCQDLIGRGYSALDPRRCDVFTLEQRRNLDNLPVTKTSPFTWVVGEKLSINAERHTTMMPAQLVFWNYNRDREPYLRENGAHGGAAYFTWEGSVVRALLECIGRDGFFENWIKGEQVFQVNLSSIPNGSLSVLLHKAQQRGFTVSFIDVTSSIIAVPSFFCVLTRNDDLVAAVSGGHGCALSVEDALYSSLEEGLSMYHWLINNRKLTSEYTSQDFESMRDFKDTARLSYWADIKNKNKISFFTSGPQRDLDEFKSRYTEAESYSVQTDKNQLEFLIQSLPGQEFFVYTSPNLSHKRMNFHSVKVVVPELIPMYHNMRFCPLKLLKIRGINPQNFLPHPFP